MGGAAWVKSTMDSLAARCACVTLRLDAGDEMQGTLPSNLSYGRTTIEAFDRMGIQAAAIGNHDFDWSVDTLQARMRDSDYPWVAANIFDSTTGAAPDLDHAVADGPRRTLPGGRRRLHHQRDQVDRGPAERGGAALRLRLCRRSRTRWKPRARRIPTSSSSWPTQAAAATRWPAPGRSSISRSRFPPAAWTWSSRVTATRCIDTERGGVPIVQARNNGTAVGVVDIVRTAAGSRRYDVRVETVWDDKVAPDTALARLVNRAVSTSDSLARRVVTDLALPLTRTGDQYALGNLMADAYRNVLRTDAALVNNGGIRADLAAGPLTFGQLFTVMPFQNRMVSVTVTGAQLRDRHGGRDHGDRARCPHLRVDGDVRRDPARGASRGGRAALDREETQGS